MLLRTAQALLLALPVFAQAEGCGTINLAYYDHGALYSRGADGKWRGIDKDVMDEVARRTGCRFNESLESRVRIWTAMENGTLDMTVSGIPYPEREKFARFIPYFVVHNYVVLSRDAAARTDSLESFLAQKDMRVAVVKSFKHGPQLDAWIDKLRAEGRVYDAPDFSAVVRLLRIGRVHAILALPTSWSVALAREMASADVKVLDWAPKEKIISALVLSRKRMPEATAERIATAVREMRADGTLKTIYTRHVGAEMASPMLDY